MTDIDKMNDELMSKYKTAYERYAHPTSKDEKITYDEFKSIVDGVKKEYVDNLLSSFSIEELRDEWFKDYGTMNGWGWETSFKFAIASMLHDIDRKANPTLHERRPPVHSWSCWHEDNCSCGLCSSCDSSD